MIRTTTTIEERLTTIITKYITLTLTQDHAVIPNEQIDKHTN